LKEVKVDFIPDRTFGGFGGDPERRWNWEMQFQRVSGFSAKVFGSMQRAEEFRDRLVERFNRPDVYLFCPLFYVEGRVPWAHPSAAVAPKSGLTTACSGRAEQQCPTLPAWSPRAADADR
jgi:hypothetical protein